jgi:hypothetical protein
MEEESVMQISQEQYNELLKRISELENGLSNANKGIAEAKNLPSVQAAKNALNTVVDAESKVKPILEGLLKREKTIIDIQASAEKKDSDIKAVFDAISEKEAISKGLIDTIEKNFNQKNDELSEIITNSKVTIEDQHNRIEALIPGATSAKLASAFKERKEDVAKGGCGWIFLLVASALGLVFAGVMSWINPGEDFWKSLPSRTIVVVGLLLIEEFSRRNYNIKRRLSESYGYKEVLSRSFHGYKEAMTGVSLPKDDKGIQCKADEKLVDVFLNALADEPGKNIFDKEKSVTFSEKLAEKLVEVKPDDNSLIGQLIKGNALSKITWPIVAIFAIFAISVCLVLCCKS